MSNSSLSLNLAPPPVSKTANTELIYALPKTYNGKTVTDLFPEFKHNSILRFSKLFGLGRSSSLPKVWKGSRKRKKQKSNQNQSTLAGKDEANNLKEINSNQQATDTEDDIFKLLDDTLSNKKDSSKPNGDEEKFKETSPIQEEAEEEELEYEPDDEVDFLKPFVIEKNSNKFNDKDLDNQNKRSDLTDEDTSTWRYGPASYWYETSDPNIYILKKPEALKKKEEKKEETQEEKQKTIKEEPEEVKSTQDDLSSECETLNLTQALNNLNILGKEETFLLVNTINWEDNIILDTNQTQTVNYDTISNRNEPSQATNQSTELINERIKYAGWVPSSDHRTLLSYQSKILGKKADFLESYKDQAVPATQSSGKHQSSNAQTAPVQINWNSIFPNENYDFVYGDWEKKIILDPKQVDSSLMNPPEFYIDPNDDNLLLGVPDDPLLLQSSSGTTQNADEAKSKENEELTQKQKDKSKIYENRNKITKSLLGRSGVIKEDAANEQEDSNRQSTNGQGETKNFWNISNDEYYNPKIVTEQQQQQASKNVSTTLVIQHTQGALELRQPFFQTHFSTQKLRNFHRFTLKKYLNGPLMNEAMLFPISSLLKKGFHLTKKLPTSLSAAISAATSNASNLPLSTNNTLVSIQNAADLSASDSCELILAEYSEQYPPLMMQPGMATKIRNYYKRKFAKDEGPNMQANYGELVYVTSSPFLGSLKPGEFLQSLENYMFRAPIYMHKMPEQDFLLIRSRNLGYFIRGDFKNIFVVGQECPLIEVPGPNSKRANSFIKDFLQAFIFRLFHRSREIPKRIKMEDIKRAFPTYAESSIRKRLKLCADFKRNETDANWWVLKEEVRLPTEEEIRQMVTPEQCCAFYSMLAAEQRLKDAGYGEKNLFASDDDDVDNIKIDDEVKNAPWHTTRAYLDANKGKCLLAINGVADPTGRGEGFSYVRQPFKNKQDEEAETKEKNAPSVSTTNTADLVSSPQPQTGANATAKRTVTGTDADLRRLHLSQAKELLAKYGVPDSEIKKLKRWEIIDVVRTMSTQKAKEGNGAAVSKFARGNRYSQSDAHEKFREECQRLFELQNRNLASEEFLSTDDDEDLDEDSDVDEMGKNLESMLSSKVETNNTNNSKNASSNNPTKPIDSSTELKNLIMDQHTGGESADAKSKNSANSQAVPPNMHRVLRITRTYRDEETGQEYTKVETVKKPLIIDAYVKIRTTKDDEFIKSAFALDEDEKEKLRKEKRRIQEQLRRVKRNEAKRANDENSPDVNGAPVHKVRKYTKSGLARKPKATKMKVIIGENGEPISVPDQPMKRTYTKSSLHFSSGDEDKTHLGEGGATGDQSNMLDTTASSLNNTNPLGVVKKRKYNKRKKPDDPNNPSAATSSTDPNMPSGTAGISKVEGTKLIIQKKAIKLLNNEGNDSLFSLDGSITGKPKKPRVSKKLLKQQQMQQQQLESSLMVVDTSTNLDASTNPDASNADNPNASLQAPKLKIINKNKLNKSSNPSLILHIPKDKIGMSSTTNQDVSGGGTNSGTSNSVANSPSVDVTSISGNETQSSQQQQQTPQQQPQKRQYNKQNSLIKKQQKMLLQQQQQQLAAAAELQLKLQMQSPFAQAAVAAAAVAASSNQQQLTAALAAASQFTNLIEQQQFMLALQQIQQQQQINPSTPNTLNKQISQSGQAQSNQMKRKASSQSSAQLDYLIKPHKKVDRRHADPLVSFSSILENILNEIREFPDAQAFLMPVNSKKVVDYYSLIKNPIDLQTIRKRINEKYYKDRQSFIDDFKLLVENSALYNGTNHPITSQAENLYFICNQKVEEKQDKLSRLEKAINPLLDDNSVIAFNYLLDQIYETHIMQVENSFSFLKPVNKTKYKDYYDIIKNPINLEEIKSKINNKKYKSRDEFIFDFELLFNNCLTYNGLNNSYTTTAQNLLNRCKKACNSDYKDQLKPLEEAIQLALLSEQNNDDENSQGVAYSVDGESTSNVFNESEIYDSHPTTSSAVLSTNMMQSKKPKAVLNNKNKLTLSKSSLSNPGSEGSMPSGKLKNKQFFFASMPSNKNSPRSGSDAEVFVDVESIDDRGFPLLNQANFSRNNSKLSRDYEDDQGGYNDDDMSGYQ